VATEFVIAGRRPLPGSPDGRPWSATIEHFSGEDEDEDEDEAAYSYDEGSCEIAEVSTAPGEYLDFVAKRAGFVPTTIVSISPAGFEFSEAAADLIAAAIDGVYFIDTDPEYGPYPPLLKPEPPHTLEELEQRLDAALHAPREFLVAQSARERAEAAEADRRDPAAAARRRKDSDGSDL
jgi:hypothetical protein